MAEPNIPDLEPRRNAEVSMTLDLHRLREQIDWLHDMRPSHRPDNKGRNAPYYNTLRLLESLLARSILTKQD